MKRSEFVRRGSAYEHSGINEFPVEQCSGCQSKAGWFAGLAEEAGVEWDPEFDPVPLLLHPGRDLGDLTAYGDRCRAEAAAANNAIRRFLAGPAHEADPGNPSRNAACVQLLGLLAEERLKFLGP